MIADKIEGSFIIKEPSMKERFKHQTIIREANQKEAAYIEKIKEQNQKRYEEEQEYLFFGGY